MNKESLAVVLKETSTKAAREGRFSFDASQGVALMVSTGGPLLAIERITSIAQRDSYLAAETERGERYFVETDRIVAVRQHAVSAGSGFLPDRG